MLGEKIATPFVYNVDSSHWEKELELKIVQRTSMAPIFGDTDYWDKNVEACGWRGTPSTCLHSLGFKKLFWNFKEV